MSSQVRGLLTDGGGVCDLVMQVAKGMNSQ